MMELEAGKVHSGRAPLRRSPFLAWGATATAGGVQTDHVSAAFDVGKFLDDIQKLVQKAGGRLGSGGAALTPQQQAKIEQVIQNPRVEFIGYFTLQHVKKICRDVQIRIRFDWSFTVTSAVDRGNDRGKPRGKARRNSNACFARKVTRLLIEE